MALQGKVDREEIYKQISKELSIPMHEVKQAIKHQFQATADYMASANRETLEFPTIRLQYFGKFHALESRIKHLQK